MPFSTISRDFTFTWHSPEPALPNPAARIVFAIPAKDEEDRITECIAAFENQTNDEGNAVARAGYEVLILVNNTTDATIERALAAKSHPGIHVVSVELPLPHAHIGWARRLAMEWASDRLRQNERPEGIIVSTDSDSRIAPDFVQQLTQIFSDQTVDAVGASLAVQSEVDGEVFDYLHSYFKLEGELRQRVQQESTFSLMHSHFSGAGIAVRQRVFDAVGGLSPLPYNEDKQLYYKLLQCDARILMSDRLVVHTSGRVLGRTEWGMAAQFRQWQSAGEKGEPVFVASARAQWLYLQFQMALYEFWATRSPASQTEVCLYLEAYQLPEPVVFLSRIDFNNYFGQYWCCVWEHPKMVEARQRTFPAVPVRDGIAEYSLLLSDLNKNRARRA